MLVFVFWVNRVSRVVFFFSFVLGLFFRVIFIVRFVFARIGGVIIIKIIVEF